MSRHQLSYLVTMLINNIVGGTTVVVTVQCGGALQADRDVTGLTEEPQLLTWMERAEDGPTDASTGL